MGMSRSVFALGQEQIREGRRQPTAQDGRRRSQYMPTAMGEELPGKSETVPWGLRTFLESGDCGMVMERVDAACASTKLAHETATRAVYVVDGMVFLRMGDEQKSLRRGDFGLIPAGVSYQFATGGIAALLLTVQISDYFSGLAMDGRSMRGAITTENPLPARTNGSMAAAEQEKVQREAAQRARRSGKPIVS